MNPNDLLAALNALISVAMLLMGLLFMYSLWKRRQRGRLEYVFVLVMGIIYFVLMLDYGTTGALRFIDIVAFPGIPHSLLPDFNIFPFGITLLIVWRIVLAVLLWSLLFYVIVVKRGVNDEDRGANDEPRRGS